MRICYETIIFQHVITFKREYFNIVETNKIFLLELREKNLWRIRPQLGHAGNELQLFWNHPLVALSVENKFFSDPVNRQNKNYWWNLVCFQVSLFMFQGFVLIIAKVLEQTNKKNKRIDIWEADCVFSFGRRAILSTLIIFTTTSFLRRVLKTILFPIQWLL